MQISFNGLALIKDAEGFRANAYRDSAGVWTIGYGTTHIQGAPVLAGMTCTQAQAELWLQADLAPVQTSINQFVKVPLTQPMFDSLCSFAYNEGIGALGGSTLLRLLNMGDYKGASNEFPKWDKEHRNGQLVVDPGLYSRRLREQSLFIS